MGDFFPEKKGRLVDSYARVSIYEGFPFFYYEVSGHAFSAEEAAVYDALVSIISGRMGFDEAQGSKGKSLPKAFVEGFREKILKPITYGQALEFILPSEDYSAISSSFLALVSEHLHFVKNPALLAELVFGDSIGYGKISALMLDENLEEIMVNGYERDIFIYHRKYGHCKTNLRFLSRKDLDSLVQKIARTVGKKLDADSPLLDARLPDGNRANATYTFVTPFGPSLTIRKFTGVPLSIVDLISNNTLSSEVAAFLWVMVEGLGVEPMNIIVTGGSSSGKTTTLNALASFIRFPERIVSIEDTLELQLRGRENWVQMEARPRIGVQEGVYMDDLLRNAMRMRPDRLIVGEVRGSEAQVMFVAMDTGHKGCLGTLHGNSAKEMLLRLKSEPMSVPEPLLSLLNLVVVQSRLRINGKGIVRRVISVTEVSSMESRPLLSNAYEWNGKEDALSRTSVPIALLDLLSQKTLRTKKEIEQEIGVRRRVLEWMLRNGLTAQPEVELLIQQYYYNPDEILAKVLSDTTS
ncbi:MAG: CpaF family protein [Candidatus Diapherotrites archaeon]|uniref:CpaF family protein n=1 Tax=Candidatus Iainarchaeum sp. TaxID=3101447 RepID=A0A8T3YIZ3_9ARCH|nr:CpaF family protein [Candidatus Diapherotrites archaeon]